MPNEAPSPRPLPESLTRFLTPPLARAPHPTNARRDAIIAELLAPRPNRALRITLLWAGFYNIAGFVIIALLWRSML